MERSPRISGAAYAATLIGSLALWASFGFGIVAVLHRI